MVASHPRPEVRPVSLRLHADYNSLERAHTNGFRLRPPRDGAAVVTVLAAAGRDLRLPLQPGGQESNLLGAFRTAKAVSPSR